MFGPRGKTLRKTFLGQVKNPWESFSLEKFKGGLEMEKLNVKSLALGLGLTWGISMLFIGWISATGWGAGIVNVISSLYIGFKSTFWGGILGGIWGFVDGFVGGAIIALVYNWVNKK